MSVIPISTYSSPTPGLQISGQQLSIHQISVRQLKVWMLDQFCFTPWYTAALAEALKRHGLSIRLVCSNFSREPHYFRSRGLSLEPGPLNRSATLPSPGAPCRLLRLAEALFNTRALQHTLKTKPPHVLHFQQTPLLSKGLRSDFALVASAHRAGVPIVHTVHNLVPHDTGHRLHSIYAEFYTAVDHLICHSTSTAEQLRAEFRVPADRVTVIPHGPLFASGVHIPVNSARERLGLPFNRRIFLFQGIFAPYKGLDTLLRAWKICIGQWQARGDLPPLLLIAGSGPSALELEVLRVSAVAGPSIRADLAYIPTERLPQYYAAADILVYPYRQITTSGALLTGLSYCKPILASWLPAFGEYLNDGDNARLVEPDSPRSLAHAIQALAREGAGTLYEQLGPGAARNRERYTSWDAIAEQTLALYGNLRKRNAAIHSCN